VVDAVLWQKGLRRFTSPPITDVRRFKNALDRIRRHGYATHFGEMEEGIRCLAAPVFGRDGEVIAAMSVSGPVGRLTRVRLLKLVFSIKRITAELSESLRASA
jgi:IclR family acetate operon transcriptional repressor